MLAVQFHPPAAIEPLAQKPVTPDSAMTGGSQ